MGAENIARIEAYIGASGSGKSTAIKQLVRKEKPKRLIIIDPMGEYAQFAEPVPTIKDLLTKVRQKSFNVSFKTSRLNPVDQFEIICDIAYTMGDMWLLPEELQMFTKAGSAPPSWSDCTLRGRHRGLTLIGATQRPAVIDKNFFGNCTKIRTGRLNYKADIVTMADVLNVPKAQVQNLLPFHYIEKDMATGIVTTGMVQKLK
jgi:hypothetical protein